MQNPVDSHLILASNSPRRRQLLAYIAPDYECAPARNIDETYPADLDARRVAPYLSALKAGAYSDLATPGNTVITADTTVILDGRILGKPRDGSEACQMLDLLSGRTHHVVTGVTLMNHLTTHTFATTTAVTFDTLTPGQIEAYVNEFAPLDKAGAYGIQEWIGAVAISRIDGSFYNVMGLPLHDLYNALKQL